MYAKGIAAAVTTNLVAIGKSARAEEAADLVVAAGVGKHRVQMPWW